MALKLQGVYVSHETIYHKIYAEIRAGRLDRKYLRWERPKRRCRLSKRAPRDLTKISIESRPDLSSRAEFGHWEGDTVELVLSQIHHVTLVLTARHNSFIRISGCTNRSIALRPRFEMC